MAELTRHFGEPLIILLSHKWKNYWPDFPETQFEECIPDLESLSLMKRIDRIADQLAKILPVDRAWELQKLILGPPLDEKGQTFNDGYWMLPLAAYWARHRVEDFEVSMTALEALTQRGTCEFAVRPIIVTHPQKAKDLFINWIDHQSFHVRRLVSEGTRPYLPWGGKLAVSREDGLDFLEMIASLKNDTHSYVRRSVGNHVRDWRRMDASIAEKWIARHKPNGEILKLALPKRKRKLS